jgi:hypothetical protein
LRKSGDVCTGKGNLKGYYKRKDCDIFTWKNRGRARPKSGFREILEWPIKNIAIIIIIFIIVYCHRPFLPGTSLEPAVILTAQASSFTLQ